MRTIATLAALLLLSSGVAAGPITVEVTVTDEEGNPVPVRGARVAVVAADQPVDAEQLVTTSSLVTGENGRIEVERPAGEVVVLAGMALRGIAFEWAGPLTDRVIVTLPREVRLRGRLLDPDGEPVVAAEVLVAPERASDTGGFFSPGTVLFRALSDGDGRFLVPRLAEGRRYRLRADARGLAATVLRDLLVDEEPKTITLAAGAIVRGIVIASPGGEPVEGATVRVGEVEGRSGEYGKFELIGVLPGSWPVRVEAAGRVHVEEEEIVLSEGEVRRGIVLRVLARGRLRGRVLTPSTAPADGARIYLRYPGGTDYEELLPPDLILLAGRTDPDGRFDLKELLPAAGVDLIVVHEGHAPMVHFGYSVVAGVTFSTVVLLREGGTVEGVILDGTDRSPVAGAEILVVDEREDVGSLLTGDRPVPPTAGRGSSGEDGVFRVTDLSTGRKTIVVRAEGRPPQVTPGVDVAPRSVRAGLVFYLGAGAVVTGDVRDGEGAPIVGARVRLVPDFGPALSTVSDDTGRFRFEGVPTGPYELRVAADGYLPSERVYVEAPAEDLEVTLDRGAGLAGRVLIEQSDEPARGAIVRAHERQPESPLAPERPVYRLAASARSDPETGSFEFAELPAGRYRLTAHTEDGLHGVLDAVDVIPGEGSRPVELRVRAGLGIHGRVVAAGSGEPVEGAVVAVHTGSDAEGPLRAVSVASGHFVIPGVLPGFHTLTVTARDYAPATVKSVEVRHAADSFIEDVVLRRGTVVRGSVQSVDGNPRSGASVTLESADYAGTLRARTDEFGEFRFDRVSEGSWLATVTDPVASMRRERLIRVEEGVELTLRFGTGVGATLTGAVTTAGEPIPFARLSALSIADDVEIERVRYSATADDFGNYLLADIPPGEYLVEVSAPGRKSPPVRRRVDLPPGPLTIEDFEIPESGVVVEVEALDTGEAVPGATVRVELETVGGARGFVMELLREVGEVRTAADGRARIEGLPPGLYRLSASKAGYALTVVPRVRVLYGEPAPVRIALPEAGGLTGVVLDEQRRPLSGVRVEILDEAGRTATRDRWVEADSAGRFAVRTLRAGRYTVRARADGRSRNEAIGVDVVPGRDFEIELLLRREGRLELTVYGAGGIPLAGARVSVVNFWGRHVPFPRPEVSPLAPFRDPDLTDEDGKLIVTHLPPGVYTIEATYPGLTGPPARVQVLEGEQASGVVVLLPVEKPR